MRSTRLRRSTTAAALLTCAALLAGCTSDSGDTSAKSSTAGAKRPAPKPTPTWDPRPDSIASVGDSITRGFDACSVLSDCPEVSWSTGTDMASLAQRLLPDPTRRSWNYAKTGAVVADLPAQLRSATAQRPELVTVMIGANDACQDTVAQMTPAADFRTQFASSLSDLRRALPKTQVYVASVPDLKRLWSEGRKDPVRRQVWKLGICPSMLRDAQSTHERANDRREQVNHRVQEYNAALRDVCAKDVLCRYDGAVHAYRFTGDELSQWDWFHPSKEGQQKLASLAYTEITRRDDA
ncbi:SGNH/GDSL hydrolase family protein [Streptomyces sp. NPDC057676]|uniref:SGNH/GDSL hydrolase family protein n=1 Tax=Streptomyces sp. NPDC057676 TaxID=3346205 RepID=UPI00368EAC71